MTEPALILLVEDEPFLAKVVQDSLEQRGYRVTLAGDGRTAFRLFEQALFSLCIIDVMLPQVDGFTLVKQLRMLNRQVPVLFLTARTATKDVMAGYESGGNDYLKKPFSLEELFLRVNELLRRETGGDAASEPTLSIGGYQFDHRKQTLVFPDQDPIRLSYRETQLLQLLCEYKNEVMPRRQALLTLWGDDTVYHTRSMDVFITRLRKHLQADQAVEIINLRGVGYKLICL